MTDPAGLDRLDKATRSADQLLGLLNDVLDLARIEADRLTLELTGFRVGSVVDDLMASMSQRAADKRLRLQVAMTPEVEAAMVRGDPLRLGQVLVNLVANAIKFSDRGVVEVKASASDSEPGWLRLRFEVSDQGRGISRDDIARLFRPFEQLDGATTREFGGSGLGLAISKRLVQMMDGEIGVDSTPGQGASFWFTAAFERLPASAGDARGADASGLVARLRQGFGGACVLLAEDDPINQEVTVDLLADAGLTVDSAANGVEALDLARQKPYALILMDMQMPQLDGLDATRQIRRIERPTVGARVPIVAMTANAFASDREACLEAGMDDYIAKPVDPGRLYAVVLKWLEAGRS